MTSFLHARRPLADAVFRCMLSGIFIVAGLNHLLQPQAVIRRLLAAPLADLVTAIAPPSFLVMLTGVILLIGGLGLLTGYRTRLAALVLMAALIPITVTVQLAPGQAGPLFKNIAIFGALLHFLFAGSGAFSLDAVRAARGRVTVTA